MSCLYLVLALDILFNGHYKPMMRGIQVRWPSHQQWSAWSQTLPIHRASCTTVYVSPSVPNAFPFSEIASCADLSSRPRTRRRRPCSARIRAFLSAVHLSGCLRAIPGAGSRLSFHRLGLGPNRGRCGRLVAAAIPHKRSEHQLPALRCSIPDDL